MTQYRGGEGMIPDDISHYANLTVAAYVSAFHGGSPTKSIRFLNAELGMNYSAQALQDWRNGQRLCPRRVMDYMRRELIKHHCIIPDEAEEAEFLAMLSL